MSHASPSLVELQHAFANFLASAPGMAPTTELLGTLAGAVTGRHARIAIYKNNVFTRLIDALSANYPAVTRLVGVDFFRFAAREYVTAKPARDRALLLYGHDFAEFLETFEPAASVPYLADVARLEQAYLFAYHAAEAEPLGEREFCAITGESETASVRLHASAQLLSSVHPISRIWEINVSDAPIEGEIEIPGGGEYLLIVRPRAAVEVRRVSAGAFAALVAIRDGRRYDDALAAAARHAPRAVVHRHLRSLAAGGSFCRAPDEECK